LGITEEDLTQAILSQVLAGILNANSSVISTIFGELSNSSNQSTAFTLLPIFWSLGAVIGPIIGGALVFPTEKFPFIFGQSTLIKRCPYIS
jgi:MFS family permease